jgi:hypothetical protein
MCAACGARTTIGERRNVTTVAFVDIGGSLDVRMGLGWCHRSEMSRFGSS